MDKACVMCAIEAVTREEQDALRRALQPMNPLTEPNYDVMFRHLAYENTTLRMIRGELRNQNREDA